jgi:hypothetical protein
MTSGTEQEIVSEFGLPEAPREGKIQRERVRGWMKAQELRSLGALYSFLMDSAYSQRIEPGLNFADYHQFVMRYLGRCIKEDVDDDWADSRWDAARDFVSWFRGLWKDPDVPREALRDLEKWLGELYKDGNEDIKRCIVDGALEHLFEEKDIERFFRGWKKDDVLRQAYAEALEWKQKGGDS